MGAGMWSIEGASTPGRLIIRSSACFLPSPARLLTPLHRSSSPPTCSHFHSARVAHLFPAFHPCQAPTTPCLS